MDPKIKLSSLPPETLQKLLEIEKRSPANQQLQVLSDIAIMVQELISVADETKADTAEQMQALGAVLTDAREQLVAINSKETPESPDYAKPVVEAISKLEQAISKIDVKPNVTVEKPDAPVVNVQAPSVDVVVDTKQIAKMLKEDIPRAFRDAIASIPEVSYPETPDRWDEVIEWLESIDTASRLKPQAPTQLKVTNPDGSPIGNQPLTQRYDYDDSTTIYTATAPVGTSDASTGWTITKYDLTDTNDASGKIATDVSWTNRGTGDFN